MKSDQQMEKYKEDRRKWEALHKRRLLPIEPSICMVRNSEGLTTFFGPFADREAAEEWASKTADCFSELEFHCDLLVSPAGDLGFAVAEAILKVMSLPTEGTQEPV